MPRRFLLLLLFILGFLQPSEGEIIVPTHSRKFTRYDNCELVPASYADGDSFRVRIGEQEFVFRLYYVDSPEANDRFPERTADQARYFGITEAESLAAGKAAKEFVYERLAGRPFTVFTRWLPVVQSSVVRHYYAVVEVEGRGLVEMLVEKGLARLHGTSAHHPDGTAASAYTAKLLALENSARANGRGAWAMARPEMQHPNIEQTEELHEMPRWLERLVFAVIGALPIAAAWTLTVLRKRISTVKPFWAESAPRHFVER